MLHATDKKAEKWCRAERKGMEGGQRTSFPATRPEAIEKETPKDLAIRVRMDSRFRMWMPLRYARMSDMPL